MVYHPTHRMSHDGTVWRCEKCQLTDPMESLAVPCVPTIVETAKMQSGGFLSSGSGIGSSVPSAGTPTSPNLEVKQLLDAVCALLCSKNAPSGLHITVEARMGTPTTRVRIEVTNDNPGS